MRAPPPPPPTSHLLVKNHQHLNLLSKATRVYHIYDVQTLLSQSPPSRGILVIIIGYNKSKKVKKNKIKIYWLLLLFFDILPNLN